MRAQSRNLVTLLTVLSFLGTGCASSGSSEPGSDLTPAQEKKLQSEIERLTHLGERTDDPILKSELLMLVGSYYTMMSDSSSSTEAYIEARRLREAAGKAGPARDSTIMAAASMAAGGRLKEAVALLEEDLQRHGKPKDAERSADLHDHLTRMYLDQGRFEGAARSARIAAENYRTLHRREQEAEILYYQAVALKELDRRERAESLLRRSYKYFDDRATTHNSIKYKLKAEMLLATAARWGVDTREWKPQ